MNHTPAHSNEAYPDPFAAQPHLPIELQQAWLGGRLRWIPAEIGRPIPVRCFGLEGDQLPVLMTHGLQSHSGWFVQSANFLAEQGHPVYAIDRRGSGLSAAPRGDVERFEQWVAELGLVLRSVLHTHQAHQAHVVGHCFGAIPATILACQQPNRIRSLVLPTPGLNTFSDLTLSEKLLIVWSKISQRRVLIPVPLSTELFSDMAEFRAFIDQDRMSLERATGRLYWEIRTARKWIQQHLGQLQVPVMMALAGHDAICDNRANASMFHAMGGGDKQLTEYAQAIHILEFSRDRDEFFRDLKDWLESHATYPTA